jgi:hypothetical protein
MRYRRRAISVIAGIAALVSTAAADPASRRVKLAILHDGRSVSPPGDLTITFDGKTIEVPIVDGALAVPADAASAGRADVAMKLGGEDIRIPALHTTMFQLSEWTLMLADKRYDEGYQSEMLPGVEVRRTCIVRYDSPDAEPTVSIVDKCRSKSR